MDADFSFALLSLKGVFVQDLVICAIDVLKGVNLLHRKCIRLLANYNIERYLASWGAWSHCIIGIG